MNAQCAMASEHPSERPTVPCPAGSDVPATVRYPRTRSGVVRIPLEAYVPASPTALTMPPRSL
jgi:hypothetical protein